MGSTPVDLVCGVQLSVHGILELAGLLTGLPCQFILDTAQDPFRGGENIIFVVEDSTRSRVAIRLPRLEEPYAAQVVKAEALHRRAIENKRIGRVQRMIGYSTSYENPVQAPLIALEWADGENLQWTDSKPADVKDRKNIIYAIAQISMDLLTVQKKGCTAAEYITKMIDRKIARAKEGNLRGGTVSECLDQKHLIRDYWMPELDEASHVMVHGDLSANNIVVDEHFHVKCVIDLSWASFVPLQFAAVYPRFLTYEPSRDGIFARWSQRSWATMERDRRYYLQCIHERAAAEGGIIGDYYRVISRDDEVKRHWWITAASRIDIHKAMVSCNWTPSVLEGAPTAC